MVNFLVENDELGITCDLPVAFLFMSFHGHHPLQRSNPLDFASFRRFDVRNRLFASNVVFSRMPSFQALTVISCLNVQSYHCPLKIDSSADKWVIIPDFRKFYDPLQAAYLPLPSTDREYDRG